LCPFKLCGRKFMSSEDLNQHIIRRHGASAHKSQPKEETKQSAFMPKKGMEIK
jgi:hypothetical protein